MNLYTKKGDDGKTGIIGPDRLDKDHNRIKSYGTIDELNSVLGIAIHYVDKEIKNDLSDIQHLLFEIGSDLASIIPRNTINDADITYLENLIDKATEVTSELKSFILPGGSKGASWLHLARTITRRAEREIVTLAKETEINKFVIPWINRLSDLFFAWARLLNFKNNVEDIKWVGRN